MLFVLLAAEGVTILQVGRLITPHVFIGMLLVPPVLLKMGSTPWKFARYYLGTPAYRQKGPPLLALRLLGPFVVVLTLAVFASGIALLLGPFTVAIDAAADAQGQLRPVVRSHDPPRARSPGRHGPSGPPGLASVTPGVRCDGAGARQWAIATSLVLGRHPRRRGGAPGGAVAHGMDGGSSMTDCETTNEIAAPYRPGATDV